MCWQCFSDMREKCSSLQRKLFQRLQPYSCSKRGASKWNWNNPKEAASWNRRENNWNIELCCINFCKNPIIHYIEEKPTVIAYALKVAREKRGRKRVHMDGEHTVGKMADDCWIPALLRRKTYTHSLSTTVHENPLTTRVLVKSEYKFNYM